MKKESFVISTAILFLLEIIIYAVNPHIDFYNVEFLHPLFLTLIPIAFLLFLCNFLRNVRPQNVFAVLAIFGVADFVLLSMVEPLCSAIVCFNRTLSALILSSLFSIIYFIVLLFKNHKKIS